MLNKVKIINGEPLTIAAKEMRVILDENSVSVFCERHKRALVLFPTPIMGVCVRPRFRISEVDEYVVEAICTSINDEFVTNLRLIICATEGITFVSKIKPIKYLIPLNIVTPHIRIYSEDFTWHTKTSLTTTSGSVLFKEDTLLVEDANVMSLNNENCTFLIFVGRGVLSVGNRLTLLYPRVYLQKHSNSSLSLGLSYSNLPSLSRFEMTSSLTIHHTRRNLLKSTPRKESVFYGVNFNIADALEPIKVTAYQKIVGNSLYSCPLLRTLNELTKKPSRVEWSKVTLIELIEIISSLLDEYSNVLDKGMKLIKYYLDKVVANQGISNQILHYIKELIKRDKDIVTSLAKPLAKEMVNKIKVHNLIDLFIALEMLPLMAYPSSHITNEIGLDIVSMFRDVIAFVRQNSLNNLGNKLTYLRSLALQTFIGAELIRNNFRVKSDLKVCIKDLVRTWSKLDEASRLISAGFSNTIQFRPPRVLPLINDFKAMYLLPLDYDIKTFLVTLRGSPERVRFCISPTKKTRVEVLNEFSELIYEGSSGRNIIELYLPYEQSEYFIIRLSTSI